MPDELTVLLVDDEDGLRKPLARYLRELFSYVVLEAATYEDALTHAEQRYTSFDVTLIDNTLMRSKGSEPEPLGVALMQELRQLHPHAEHILFTGWGLKKDWQAMSQGAFRFLSKSTLDPEEVGHLIRQAAEFGRLKAKEREHRVLHQLWETASLLMSERGIDEILNVILKAIQSMGFDRVRLYLLSDDGQHLELHAHRGMSSEFTKIISHVSEHPDLTRLFANRAPEIFQLEAGDVLPFMEDDSLSEYACIPLVVNERVIGKLGVDNLLSGRRLDHTRLDPLAVFANHAAIAIETARRQDEEKQQQQRLEVIREITDILNSRQTLPEILMELCRAVVDLFDVDHSGFVLFENERYGWVAAEYPLKGIRGSIVTAKASAEQALIYQHKPIIAADVASEEGLGEVRNLLLAYDIQSILVVPAVYQGNTLGSFSLDLIGRKRPFTHAELELCKQVASQAAAVIARTKAIDQIESMVEHSPVAIVANNREGIITSCNNRASEILGYDPKEIIGEHVSILYVNPNDPGIFRRRLEASNNDRWVETVVMLKAKNKSPVGVRLSLAHWYDGFNERGGMLGHFEEINQINAQQRLVRQSVLNQSVTDALLSAEELNEVFYWILTDATAGFGLGFNRAALLVRDFENNTLKGAMGIGYFDAEQNQDVRDEIELYELNEADTISSRLETQYPVTPLHERIIDFEMSLDDENPLASVIQKEHWLLLESQAQLDQLPLSFSEAFEPHFPLLLIALRSHDEPLGVLVADNRFSHQPVSQQTIQASITLANAAALAIRRQQRVMRTEQAADIFEKLRTDAAEIARRDGVALLDEIMRRAIDLLDARSAGILDYDPAAQLLEFIAVHADNKDELIEKRLRVGEGVAGRLVQSDKVFQIVDDYAAWPHRALIHEKTQPFGAVLNVVLKVQEEVVGVLYVDDDAASRTFTEADAKLLALFAEHAAIALKNMKTRNENQFAWQTLRDSFEASITLDVVRNPKAILQATVLRARDFAKASTVGIVLLDSKHKAESLYFTDEDWQIGELIVREKGKTVQVIKTRRPFVCEDAEQADDVNDFFHKMQVKAMLCLPFIVHGMPIGVMWFYYDAPRQFKPTEIAALELYAKQAASAYDQALKIETLHHVREATVALASKSSVESVLLQIVKSGQVVLNAASAAIWSFDPRRGEFTISESVAVGIEQWGKFQKTSPKPGQTTWSVMKKGYVEVQDLQNHAKYDFLGESTVLLLKEAGVQSFQGVCLKADGEILGVLYVNYQHRRDFTDEEHNNVITLANHAAIALKKARLYEQLEHAYETARLIARQSVEAGLKEILQVIVEKAGLVLDCDAVVLYPFDNEHNRFDMPHMAGVKNEQPLRAGCPIPGQSIIWEINQRRFPYVTPDAEADKIFGNTRFRREEGIKSLVAIPLKVLEEPVGVLFVNYCHKHLLNDDELAKVQLFADQAAVAIHDARLYEREKRRAGSLTALNHAAKALASSLELQPVLDTIVEQAWKIADTGEGRAIACTVVLVEEEKGNIVSAHPHDQLALIHDKIGKWIDLRNGRDGKKGIIGRAYARNRNEVVGNLNGDVDFYGIYPQARSAMIVRIHTDDQIIGFIVVEHEDYFAFDDRAEAVFDSLAAQAAVAIKNAREVKEMRRIKGYVGSISALRWMEMVTLGWSHQLNRGIWEIASYLHLIRRAIETGDVSETLAELTAVDAVIDDLRSWSLTEPLGAEKGIEALHITDVLESYFTKRWQKADFTTHLAVKLTLELFDDSAEPILIRASHAWLRQLFEILSENAIQALQTIELAEPHFVVRSRRSDAYVILHFENNGPPIRPEVQKILFKDRIEKQISEKGAGVGLMQATAIAETYSGTIRLDTTFTEGVRFVVQFPIEKI